MKSIQLQITLYFIPFLLPYPFNFYYLDHFQKIKVIDGDSIHLTFNNKIERLRLAYIDAPELKQNTKAGIKLGKIAKSKLDQYINGCNTLKFKVIDKDRYKRLIAEVWCENNLINLKLVKNGLAKLYYWSVFNSVDQKESFKSAYKKARKEKIGLMKYRWDPYKFRKHNKMLVGNHKKKL